MGPTYVNVVDFVHFASSLSLTRNIRPHSIKNELLHFQDSITTIQFNSYILNIMNRGVRSFLF